MDRLKKFIDVNVPVTTCTLRCHYCYITHHRLFGGPLPKFSYSPELFRKALSQKRLGGQCMFNFCGNGETLLVPEITDYIKALLDEGHFVMIVTNATVDRAFDKMEEWPKECLERLFFKFSYHYLELKKRNLFQRFFRNIRRMRDAGASFTLEATPSDELEPSIDEMKRQSLQEVGAWCHITVPRSEKDMSRLPLLSKHSPEEFYKIWHSFNSPFFDYKFSVFGQKQKGFCHGGEWSYYLTMENNSCTVRQCYYSYVDQDLFEAIDRPLKDIPIGNHCAMPHCFNAHAWLTFGAIAERNDPTYDIMRNRTCADGTEWLKPRMKSFMQQRLRDNNSDSRRARFYGNAKMCFIIASKKCAGILRRGIRRILRGRVSKQ